MYIHHFCSSINPLVDDAQVASSFWLLWIMVLWMWLYKHLFETLLSGLLGIFLEVELLDHMWVCAKSIQSCLTLCDPMDCNPTGSSVHGILQERILEWVAMPSSRGSSWPRDRTQVSYVSFIGSRFFTTSTTWEALLDHMIILFLIFWGTTILFSIAAVSFYISTNSAQGVFYIININFYVHLFDF